jgi:hypothetical protein
MKRILPILFVLAFVQSYAQKTQQSLGTKHTMVVALSDFKVDSLLFLPERDTTFTPYKNGAVVLKQSDSSLYYFAQYWRPMGGAFVKTVYKRSDSLFYQRGGAEYFVAKWGLRAFTVPAGLTATQIGDSIAVTSVLNGLVIGNGSGFATATVDTPLYYSSGMLRIAKASNDSSGYLSYFDWRAFNAKVDPSREVNGVMSITGGGPLNQNRNLSLVNDQLAPPASYYYGTNTVGVKGWFALPEGGGTSPVTSVHGRIGDIVALQSDYSDYYSLLGHTHYGLAPLGGSTGQVLKKLSNNNYDYAWMDDLNNPGSSTGVFVDTIARVGNDIVWRKNFTDYTLEKVWNQYKAGNGLKLAGDTFSLKHITVTADSNILIGTQINDGHKFYLKGQPRIDIGSDATGDTYYRNAFGGMERLAKPIGLIKPVLGFDATGMKPKWEEDKWSDTTSLSSRINLKQNISDTSTVDATRYWVQQNEIWKRNGIDVYYPGTGHVGIGTPTPQAGLEIKGAYSLSTQAALQITDTSAGGYLKLGDATTIAGNFTGAIYGKAYGTLADNRNGVSIYGEPGKDTVANAAVSVDGRLDYAPLVNAKLFRVANFLTDKFYVTASGGLWAAGIPVLNDTAEVKPLGITADGTIYRRSNWIGSGGTGSATDTTSISNRINLKQNNLKSDRSVTISNDSIYLSGEPATWGANKVYGTNASGVKGVQSAAVLNLTTPANGQTLSYYNGEWVNTTPFTATVTSPQSEDQLKWDGSKWVNYSPSSTPSVQFTEFDLYGTADQSTYTNSVFSGKHVRVWREGALQKTSTTYGVNLSGSTITFYPSLAAGEHVYIEASTAAAWTYAVLGSAIVFSTVNNLQISSGSWSATSGGASSYGNTGLSAQVLPSGNSGRIYLDGTSHHGVLGFNATNALSGWSEFEAGLVIAYGVIYKVDGGTLSSSLGSINTAYKYGIYRDGTTGTVKLQSSADGITWSDITTLTYSSTGTLYLACDISGSINSGVIVNPVIVTL